MHDQICMLKIEMVLRRDISSVTFSILDKLI